MGIVILKSTPFNSGDEGISQKYTLSCNDSISL